MANKYLDSVGLSHLWGKVRDGLAAKGSELSYENGYIYLKDANGNQLGNGIDASPFVKDGMLYDVTTVTATEDNPIAYDGQGTGDNGDYVNGEKFIKFIWNVDKPSEDGSGTTSEDGKKVDYIKADEIGKIYSGSDSISIDDSTNSISVSKVNADITKTTREMVVSSAIGDYAANTVIPRGANIMEILANIFEKTLGVTKTDPSASLTLKSGSNAGNYEYGSKIDAVWTASLNSGKYAGSGWTYPNSGATGVTASGYTWSIATGNGNEGTVAIPALTSSTTVKVTIDHSAGDMPVNNKGAEVSGSQIAAGSKAATKTYTVKNYWWVGSNANKYSDTTWTSDMVRNLSLGKVANNNVQLTTQDHKTISVTFPAGAKQMVIAVPKGTSFVARLGKSDTDPNITSDFTKHSISVLCGGTTNVDYDLCVWEATSGLSSATIVTIFL